MLLSAFSFAKTAGVICIFVFTYFYPDRNEEVWAEDMITSINSASSLILFSHA